MRKNLENLLLEKRDFLKLSIVSSLISLVGCSGESDDNPSPPAPPIVSNPSPGPQPQTTEHTYSGHVSDTDGTPLDVNVTLQELDLYRNPTGRDFTTNTNSNGDYSLNHIPTGDFRLVISIPSGYFNFNREFRIISSSGNLEENVVLIPKVSIGAGSVYRDTSNNPSILEMIKYISGNLTTDSVQRVRRFDLTNKIGVFFNRASAPTGYLPGIEGALNEWETKSGLHLFKEANNARDSNIEVAYSSSIGGKGLTSKLNFATVNGVIIPEKVKVTLSDGLSTADATTVLAREVGYSLFGAARYSKDRTNNTFKDSNYLNTNDPLGNFEVTNDEGKAVKLFYGLPIGLDLRNYK